MIKSTVKWSLYSDVVDVLGVQASVHFIQATADSLKTASYSAPPWSFDWISPIFGEMQSNDHGGVLNEEVFKLPRFFEHPDSIRKYDFNGFRQSQAKSIEMRTEGARSVRVCKPCRFP